METITKTKQNQSIHHLVLANGITTIAVENPTADIIACRIFLKNAGGCWDSKAKAGLSHLLASTIAKGTQNLSAVEIASKVESTGASLGVDAATDYFLISIKTVTSDFLPMLELTAEIMQMPSFPIEEIELEKNLTKQNIRSQQEQPFNVAFNQLREAMYPNHPYGISILGTEESVSNLTQADLKEYHKTYFRPDNLVISICGNINVKEAVQTVEKIFGNLQNPNESIKPLNVPSLINKPIDKILSQETQQSIVMLGYLAPEIKNDDYIVLKLLSTYLGNGLSSRLFVELREKRGLAYDVSCFYPSRLYDAQFVAYMGTAPENTEIAVKGLRDEVERLSEIKLSEEELQTAKNKLLGQYALGKQTNAEIAHIYGWYECLGLGIQFDEEFQNSINEVNSNVIQSCARKYFSKPYLSIVGPV